MKWKNLTDRAWSFSVGGDVYHVAPRGEVEVPDQFDWVIKSREMPMECIGAAPAAVEAPSEAPAPVVEEPQPETHPEVAKAMAELEASGVKLPEEPKRSKRRRLI
jgi:hypothetical protein